MTQPVDFQAIIMGLQRFWAEQGCLIWQPYYTQVGAGTMNPATFLRVLGPEPWKVAYVEPSVRPDDGRYGENPNRFQVHYQFQVILKPDTGNPQELYLESLKAIGIDPRQHDIRFVEDNWEQPAISAWGLGWEVWLDGQEITQFTYFQQVGGQTLDPVAVEITYGLERILIALNNADAIWNEPWGAHVRYGEVRRQEEYEHSKYYFEVADVERVRQMYELYEREANACLESGLVLPAHDYVLKCSHSFNILDTRGAVGVTERQAFFSRMRELARKVAVAYLDERRRLEYPMLAESAGKAAAPDLKAALPSVTAPADFLLEIGVEELPCGDVDAALEQLRVRIPVCFDELRLAHGEIQIAATPRRLAVLVASVAPRQADREELVKGPPADRAFDSLGQPTKAGEGFARSRGVAVSDLTIREIDGGRYAAALVHQAGRPAGEVLAESLAGLVAGIKFEKSMRWNDTNVAFSRPVRWLVALLGAEVVPFEFAGVHSGRVTRGLRPYDSPEVAVSTADAYFAAIRSAGILIDPAERRAEVEAQVRRAAAQVGGEPLLDPALLDEVTHLVEKPTALLGGFKPEFLELPRDVLVSTMKKHQRYFPVVKDGQLMPYFIAVRNGDDLHLDLVRQGNEHVLGARFADANFFVREDLKQSLESFLPGLRLITFQAKLGSLLDKSGRIEALAGGIADMLGLSAAGRALALRAAHLAKADLATRMVVEMTSLQGLMGREYAQRSGEPAEVATAIGEQYLPAPKTQVGVVIALADRLDSLTGLFAAGLAPSGAKDPFALRRAALGVVQPLVEHGLAFDLQAALARSAALQPVPVSEAVLTQVLEFIAGRLRVLLIDLGYRYDVVDAVLAAQSGDPAGAVQAVKELTAWVARPDWNTLLPGYARCVRITRSQTEKFTVEPSALVEPEETELYAALQQVEKTPRRPGSVEDFLKAFVPMVPVIDRFFDKVLVMAEDPAVRSNRLGLLQRIAALPAGAADLSFLEGF